MLGCGTRAWRPHPCVLVTCMPILSRGAGMWPEPSRQGSAPGEPHTLLRLGGERSRFHGPEPRHLSTWCWDPGVCVSGRFPGARACMRAGPEASLGITQAHKTGWGVGMKRRRREGTSEYRPWLGRLAELSGPRDWGLATLTRHLGHLSWGWHLTPLAGRPGTLAGVWHGNG